MAEPVTSGDTKDADVQKALKPAEESLCPMWTMVKGTAEVLTEYKIVGT